MISISFNLLQNQHVQLLLQMWQKYPFHQNCEKLTWKYGEVLLSDNLSLQSQNTSTDNHFYITTHPFGQLHPHAYYLESSEDAKSLQTVDRICSWMLKVGVNRESTVTVKGGGMLLDICGFACAIYMRGIKKVIFQPTTLLAIVDATVGGKNGINWAGAKNMLGLISHPNLIQISLKSLQTLDDRNFSNGLAQVIKMAITHDPQLLEFLQQQTITLNAIRNNYQYLRNIIKRSLVTKICVVQNDQFDRNSRKWLNFGHTFGHALELSRWGSQLKHGECVSIGIMQQLQIGVKLGLIKNKSLLQRIKNILHKFNLPIKLPQNININQIIDLMGKDKKNSKSNQISLTLIDGIGQRKPQPSNIQIQHIRDLYNSPIEIAKVEQLNKQVNIQWNDRFPSSKSLSIRYLYIAALYHLKTSQPILITNFLNSQDTECLKQSLSALGFKLLENLQKREIQIIGYNRNNKGELNVGNSGLTARFILPLCSFLQGQWTIKCHTRMSQRPNQQIIQHCLSAYNITCQWLNNNKPLSFPMIIRSTGKTSAKLAQPIRMKSNQSSQYISSILLNSLLLPAQLGTQTTLQAPGGKMVSQPYILMTLSCLSHFGITNKFTKTDYRNQIKVDIGGLSSVRSVQVEKDLSSLSYPYAYSLIHQFSSLPILPLRSSQGDLLFYQYCKMKILPQILPFDECTDTFMTMAILIATKTLSMEGQFVQITKIQNQRVKESNRILLTRKNLQKVGYYVQQTHDGLKFYKNARIREIQKGQTIVFETAGDHRLAMSMALLSTWLKKKYPSSNFIIDDKNAVKKTFPQFWHYLTDSHISLSSPYSPYQLKHIKSNVDRHKSNKTFIIGNRGSGKTTSGQHLTNYLEKNDKKCTFIDIDEQITKEIQQKTEFTSISDLVNRTSWEQFRKLQAEQLQKICTSYCFNPEIVIATGGGIIQDPISRNHLQTYSENSEVIYLEKDFQDLRFQIDSNRPILSNFQQRSKKREKFYEQLATHIITIPNIDLEGQLKYFTKQIERIRWSKRLQQIDQGQIYCLPQISGANYSMLKKQEIDEICGIQIRADLQLMRLNEQQQKWRILRKMIAKFKIQNEGILGEIPIILTLRTQKQFGVYDETRYSQGLKNISKIPTNFLDHQITHQITFPYNHRKLIHSYHGHCHQTIQALFSPTFSKGSLKLCYNKKFIPTEEMQKKADICLNLDDPLTRLNNKYRMCIRDEQKCELIKIPKRRELRQLKKLMHLLKR